LAIKATLAQLPPNHNDRVWAELSPADVRFLTDERDKGVIQAYKNAVVKSTRFAWNAAKGQLELFASLGIRAELVDYFFSEKIEKGAPWRQEIVKWLDMSSYLVLVFTDPDEDWGWCLYETGFFDALSRYPNSGTERRIYCLHHAAASPPSPIEDLQSIPAIPEKVEEWLEELYKNTNQTK
jgi:hypothetical protein